MTEDDLAACLATAFAHLPPGGVGLFVPDYTRETLALGTEHGGHDGTDGRALRSLEWTTDPDPTDTTREVDYAIILHEPGREPRVVHDHHVVGAFGEHTWLHLLGSAGFEPAAIPARPDDEGAPQPIFLGRRPV
ncbi:MAG: hypothetical protein M5U27_02400 [Gaiella sp.]|nr:hypothetical protein [Gaiella sp.]